jgi:hypothetical protein
MLKQLPGEILYVFIPGNISTVVIHRTNYSRIFGRITPVVVDPIEARRKRMPFKLPVFLVIELNPRH